MNYFIILRLPADYENQYDLTDLDDIVQLKMFMRYDCQPMSLAPGDNNDNYDKWLSLHTSTEDSPRILPSEEQFTVLIKSNLVEEDDTHDVAECYSKLFENITNPLDWCVKDTDGEYCRAKVLDTLISGTNYYAWHNAWHTYYTDSTTPSVGDDLYELDLDGTMKSNSTITELGAAFDEIDIFTTELGTFTKLEDL